MDHYTHLPRHRHAKCEMQNIRILRLEGQTSNMNENKEISQRCCFILDIKLITEVLSTDVPLLYLIKKIVHDEAMQKSFFTTRPFSI